MQRTGYVWPLVCLGLLAVAQPAKAGVVTLITHGFDSDADSWVTTMGEAVATYPRTAYQFGSEVPTYRLSFNGQGAMQSSRIAGPPPTNSVSGDIVLLLDWNPYSGTPFGGTSQSTTIVGPVVAENLMSTNLIPELGLPLTRFPLHLIGHSRGGSLICEIAKRLGQHDIVVDQLTMLDPHPIGADGLQSTLESLLAGNIVDGTATNGVYANVLFADDIYEVNSSVVPDGVPARGSSLRYLAPGAISTGGYTDITGPHSNIHLWYHGTLDDLAPTTSDGDGSIDQSTRAAWYAPVEAAGANAGYLYSLRGGGDRRLVQPAVNAQSSFPGAGLNGQWSAALGIPAAANRALPGNILDTRANIIELNLGGWAASTVRPFALGAPVTVLSTDEGADGLTASLAYACTSGSQCTLTVFADRDENTQNGWVKELPFILPALGSTPTLQNLNIGSLVSSLPPGTFRIGALISSSTSTREYYAPQVLAVYPRLTLFWTTAGTVDSPAFNFTVEGSAASKYAIEASADLSNWSEIATGQLIISPTNNVVGHDTLNSATGSGAPLQFFRAAYR
ncbi:MAG TPA: hypothetical protein VMF06_19475 [Candidatus Limnocylindria bacterium]|nr:hypothetical protein [Candidatus Limnocylindria bacterium]